MLRNFSLLVALICCTALQAQRKPKIKGSRVVIDVKEALSPFNEIVLTDDLDVVLKRSQEEGYELAVDDNLVDVLKFKVVDSTLVVSAFYSITAKKKLDITIYYKDLVSVTVKEGSVAMDDIIVSDVFKANVSGDARLQLKVRAALVDVTMDESSKGDFNIDADSLHVAMKGKSDALLYAVSEASSVELLKNSKLDMEGTADFIQVKLGENTNFSGARLEANSVKLDIEGSADAYINCLAYFELLARQNAKTYLYGNPKITITEFSNVAQLRKQED